MCVVHLQVATQFFALQVVVVFFASFITGSLLNQLALLLNNPGDVLKLLGTGGLIPSEPCWLLSRAAGLPWTVHGKSNSKLHLRCEAVQCL